MNIIFALLVPWVVFRLDSVAALFGHKNQIGITNRNDEAELQAFMEDFASMSVQDQKEIVKEMFVDNPKVMSELLSRLDYGEKQDEMEDSFVEENFSKAMDLLRSDDEDAWEKILENKQIIFDVVIQRGILSKEDIEWFENDEEGLMMLREILNQQ